MNLEKTFSQGHDYHAFLAKYGSPSHVDKWKATYDKVTLTAPQLQKLASYVRDMPVMVLAGAWCGDCSDQCPIFAHVEQACPKIRFRYFDRDESADVANHLRICGGARVPSVLMLSEDFQEIARYGDRTLAKYRQIFERTTGASCSTGLVFDTSLFGAVVQEWLDQFERGQLILRTSTRLREKHGD